nr:RNA-directed DNA polymerase, eukaryota [Tanacetum cinerariifolium]
PTLVSSFRRNVRGGVKQFQLVLLQALLEGLILPNASDRWIWSMSGDDWWEWLLNLRLPSKLKALLESVFYVSCWVNDKKSQQSGATKTIKDELTDIDKCLDSGNVSDEMLFKRIELMLQLHDINQKELRDNAIDGDENLKFFHGIINKKRSQLSIRGVFVNGDWNTDPCVVKDAFKDHFAARFKQPVHGRLKLNISFTNRLSTEQAVDMDRKVSRDEIRIAIWNCGENKSPGPDGYLFEFFRRYWRFVGPDFCFAVECFFDNSKFPKGCNLSFIALIPKVMDAKFVTDFRPISLIGCVYKVVTKILANRLATVILDLISDIQSAFVANKQILDGPFILNELLAWCKKKKKQAMVFKVDFAKALKINIQKSQVLGVGVLRNLVNQAASSIGCAVMQKPFRYLGVMVGDCMSRKLAWTDTVQKLRSQLSNWKVKMLSIGGRLTLDM